MNNIKKIAVIGGTGKAGKYLVNHLLNQNIQVKMLVRNPEKLKIKNNLLEIVKGDVKDFESVLSLLEGCNALVSTLGQDKTEAPIFSKATNNILKAMDKVNMKRFILVTGITLDAIGDKKGFKTKLLSKIMKLSFPAIVADKQNQYSILLESNVDWTVIRIPFIEESELIGTIKTSLTDVQGKKISTSDLAVFIFDQLSNSNFIRKAPFIAN
jgi:putative NADH-flavin reductase